MRNSGYDFACEYTMEILKHAKVERPAVPLLELCRRHDVTVREDRIWPRRALVDIDTRTITLYPGTAAFQSWYIAHELGHILLPTEFGEESCDTFAYCLLMPHEWISRDISYIPTLQLAMWYGVTPTVIKRRLKLLRTAEYIFLFTSNGDYNAALFHPDFY